MLNGKKTYIVVLIAALVAGWQAMGHEVPTWVFEILGALGLGTLRMGVASGVKKAAVTALLCVALLPGCAGLTPTGGSPASAGAPQPATNLAQNVRDQAAVPGQAYGGHVNWYFASQGAAAIQQEIIALAKAGNWTPEQLAQALASTNGAPQSVVITSANVQGGNADNAGAGTGGASGLSGTSGSVQR